MLQLRDLGAWDRVKEEKKPEKIRMNLGFVSQALCN